LSVPYVFNDLTTTLAPHIAWAVLLWYMALGFFIALSGTVKNHPLFFFHMYLLRGIAIGGLMDFILYLFMGPTLGQLMLGTSFALISPLWIVGEGMLFGIIVDFFATKAGGEGEKILRPEA